MKTNIRQDFIDSQNLLRDLGFTTNNGGFLFSYENLDVYLSPITHHIYHNGKFVMAPHIKLSYAYNGGEIRDVLITQTIIGVKQSILSSSLIDLRIKALNRNIKMYCILNGHDYVESKNGSISCMALALNPKLYLTFK
jgi:hypothetical protein